MARPSNTNARREQIAFALARVMVRTGYDRATVAEVAREAGLPTGSLHYHFGSKGEILTDLVDRLVLSAQLRIDSRAAQARDPRARLTAILDGLLDTQPDADELLLRTWASVGAEASRNPEVAEIYGRWLVAAKARLRSAFVAACRAEGRSARGATRAATALLALVEGYYAVGAGTAGVIATGSAAPSARRVATALLDAQCEVAP